jgi:transposase
MLGAIRRLCGWRFSGPVRGRGFNNRASYWGGTWDKMFRYFQFRREDFLARYHKRSNVEVTFSMIKRKFRDGLRSRTDVAMVNESLCKVALS